MSIKNLPTIIKNKVPAKNGLTWILEAGNMIIDATKVQDEQETIRLAIERKHEQTMASINTMKEAVNFAMQQQHQKEALGLGVILEGVMQSQNNGNLEELKSFLDALVKITTNPGVARAGAEILKNFK